MAIMTCTCKHKTQDELHGPQKRVFNHVPKRADKGAEEYRCTVCGRITQTREEQR